MAQSVQHRRDTAANWTSVNPTLLAGQFGIETDTGKFKIGNGATAWASLAYAAGESAGGGTAPVLGTCAPASGPVTVYPGSNGSSTGTKVGYFEVIPTGAAYTITVGLPRGSWSQGERLRIVIVDNGTVKTLSWDAAFSAINVVLPTATIGNANKIMYIDCAYNELSYGTHNTATFDVTGISL